MSNCIGKVVSDLVENQYFQESEIYKKIDFENLNPNEVIMQIFSYFNAEELTRCFLVSKKWKILTNHEHLWKALHPTIAFGKKQWAKYFGKIGKEPLLPIDIHKIFKRDETIAQTHMLVLIPETVDDKPLNLKTLGELVKAPKEGHATQYERFRDVIAKEHGHQPTAKSHWVLMKKSLIKKSIGKSYIDQQELIAKLAKKTGIDYEVPNALDVAICIFIQFISSKKIPFNSNAFVSTRCQEKIQSDQVAVGCFSAAKGLNIYQQSNNELCGIAAMRKFF